MNQTNKLSNEKNIRDMETQMLASIAKSTITAIGSSIEALSNLLENLKTYKDCVDDCVKLYSESADRTTEYTVSAYYQPYILPGVVSVPPANYDKGQGERKEQLKANKEKTLNQKRVYLRLVQKDSKLFFQSLKGIQTCDVQFEEFLEILNGNINLNLQPFDLYDDPKKSNPSIKLTLSNDFLDKD
jgi:hypothetical protein